VIKIPHADTGPYLPGLGEVYLVDSSIIHPADGKPDRPALVVQVPATVNGRITVVTRTSNRDRTPGVASPEDPDLGFDQPGVASPEDPELGLDQPGVWGHLTSAEANLWTPSMVRYRGTVDLAVLIAVREEFGL
jgi:hypothetical protein